MITHSIPKIPFCLFLSALCVSFPTLHGPFLMRTLDLSRGFAEAEYCIIYHSA